MIPWWSGFLLFISGIIVGGFIVVLGETEDEPLFKFKRKER